MIYLLYLSPFWLASKLFYVIVVKRQFEKNHEKTKAWIKDKKENHPELFVTNEEGTISYVGSQKGSGLKMQFVWLAISLLQTFFYLTWLIVFTIMVNTNNVSYAMPVTMLCLTEGCCFLMPSMVKSTAGRIIYRVITFGLLGYISYIGIFT